MSKLRIDHMIEQYVWTLENDQAFVTKARTAINHGNFNEFRRVCGIHIAPTRKAIGEDKMSSITGWEWSFLYLETWIRLGGFHCLMDTLYYNQDVQFQLGRLEEADMCITSNGVIKRATTKNPCAEVFFSQPQPCVLAEPEKEIPVSNKIIIKNVTFINNVDVTSLNDDQLIDAIKTIESEIADLKSVKTKSAKIAAKILEAQGTLSTIVELLDGRA